MKRAALCIIAILSSSPAIAQQQQQVCANMDGIARSLGMPQYGERETMMLINREGTLALRLFTNPATQSWSLLSMSIGNNVACFVATGTGILTGMAAEPKGKPL